MLHTLNKAWMDILVKQLKNGTIKNCLCVCMNDNDLEIVEKATIPENCYQINTVYFTNDNDADEIFEISQDVMFDDILISHNLHNPIIKDFLSKHCTHKNS